MSTNLTNILRHQVDVAKENSDLIFFRLSDPSDGLELESLFKKDSNIRIYDSIHSQLKDLIKLRNPKSALTEEASEQLIQKHLGNISIIEYGVWVYYPWSNSLVHILDESEFIEVRTVRNKYKISAEEQFLLSKRKIGIIGLSVGQSVCLSIVSERLCGELRIADFDHLELSNMNRIRTSLTTLGISKTEMVARQVLEIDPFIKVVRFNEGINQQNIDSFFDDSSRLDLLIEECDSLEIKILSRLEAKKRKIPVLMDTSDRGMIDVERYDKEPEYPLLHGLINESIDIKTYASLKTSEEKLPYLLPILGVDKISDRLRMSGIEVGSSITTWPQLATDVNAGGAITAIVCRQILLGQKVKSGRYYCDFESIIFRETLNVPDIDVNEGAFDRRSIEFQFHKYEHYKTSHIPKEIAIELVKAANMGSSPGNSQKWLWYYKNGLILLFIDKSKSRSFADNFHFGTLVGFGCAIENLRLKALEYGLEAQFEINDSTDILEPKTIITFSKTSSIPKNAHLSKQIELRTCNRFNVSYKPLEQLEIERIQNIELEEDVKLTLILDRDNIMKISSLICVADRIRLVNKNGHRDFFENEIRWDENEAAQKKDGLDITLFDLTASDRIGLSLAKTNETNFLLNKFNGGSGFEKISKDILKGASALGIISVPSYSNSNLILGGISSERIWLTCSELGLGFQPYTSMQMLFSRLHQDDLKYLNETERNEVVNLKTALHVLTNIPENHHTIFLFRLTKTDLIPRKSFRKPIENNLIFG